MSELVKMYTKLTRAQELFEHGVKMKISSKIRIFNLCVKKIQAENLHSGASFWSATKSCVASACTEMF